MTAGWKPTALSLRLPACPDAPGRARRALGALSIPEALMEELRFLVGEVVAERVCADRLETSAEIGLEVRVATRTVRAELQTGSSGRPADASESERRRWEALASILEALALRWGVSEEEGETIWFELARDIAGEAAEDARRICARIAQLHAQAAEMHERAARFHQQLGESRRRRGESSAADQAGRLAVAERHRAERERFMARRAVARS